MLLAGCRDNALAQWSIDFLMTIGDQLSTAVKNAQLYEDAQRELAERKRAEEELRNRNRELAVLNAVAATVNQSLDLEEILGKALDKVLETMGLEVGAIRLLDEQASTLDLEVHRGVDLRPQVVESISRAKLTDSPMAETVAIGVPLIMEDISANPIVELIGRGDLKSLAMIPLKSKGQMLGTMEAVSLCPRQFTSEEIQLLISVGHQIGVVIENARLYQKAQQELAERKRAEEALQKAHDELEMRVQERTAQLAQANEALRAEIIVRKQAEEELIRLSSAVKSSVDSIVIIDVEGKIIDVNEAALKMYATDDQEGLIGQNVLAFIAPEYREKGQAGIEFVLEKGYDMSRGYEIITKDGRRIPVELSATAMKDADGKPIGIVNIARDITERKQAEEKLRDREATMRALLNAPIEMAVLMDADGTILALNEAAAQSLGRSTTDELIGLCVYDLFPPAVAEFRKAQVDTVFRSGTPLRFEDGREGRFFDHSLYPVFDAQGKVVRMAVYVHDITYRRQAEEEIHDYQERLRSMAAQLSSAEERERRRLATALHDDIAQTLALSKIKLGVMQESVSSTDLAESLYEIQRLIELAIQATRSLTFEISSPILYQLGLVAAVEWLTKQARDRHGIRSEFWDDRQPKPLHEDVKVLLFQAVRELLINVVKHAQAHSIKVFMRRDGHQMRITVEDDGVGFDSSDSSLPWSKAEGFGLFSIRERLEPIGGRVEIVSQEGHGTRVTLVVPLVTDY
jgi:PAS domain S-box-containing protein